MSGRVVAEYKNRYMVQTGQIARALGGRSSWVEWEWAKAFREEADALAYAARIAEDHPYVRVLDREGDDDD